MTRADAIRRIGGGPERIEDAVRPKGVASLLSRTAHRAGRHARTQCHPRSASSKASSRSSAIDAVITGLANHAGTTPMAERQDALVAASQLTLAVREIVTRARGPAGRHRRPARRGAERAERDSRRRAADDRVARSVDRRRSTRWPSEIRARAREDRRRHAHDDRDHQPGWQSAGRGGDGSAARDRARGRRRCV